MPLKVIEYNLKIYLMLFELKKIHVFIDFHFVVFTHDIFLYQQFIYCMLCSGLWETLNIMKSISDECKESARKISEAKINEALLRMVLKK